MEDMGDLYFAVALMCLLSAGAFACGWQLGKRAGRLVSTLMALLALAFIGLHFVLARDRIVMARFLPFSNVIILGSWLPLAAALLGGLAWARGRGSVWRKGACAVPLVIVAICSASGPLLGTPPACGDDWENAVCLQTSEASCGAASAATLLAAHGISATENEMARLCLTRRDGTAPLGLYRGLKLKTRGTAWAVETFASRTDELRTGGGLPAILLVRYDKGASADPRYEREWGWSPGVTHMVVVFRFTADDKVEVGEPMVGRERWSVQGLRLLWHGKGLRLVRAE